MKISNRNARNQWPVWGLCEVRKGTTTREAINKPGSSLILRLRHEWSQREGKAGTAHAFARTISLFLFMFSLHLARVFMVKTGMLKFDIFWTLFHVRVRKVIKVFGSRGVRVQLMKVNVFPLEIVEISIFFEYYYAKL